MRKTEPAIIKGDMTFLLKDDPQVIMYLRRCEQQTLLVVTNNSDAPAKTQWPEEVKNGTWQRILSNREETAPSMERTQWLPWEAELYTLSK